MGQRTSKTKVPAVPELPKEIELPPKYSSIESIELEIPTPEEFEKKATSIQHQKEFELELSSRAEANFFFDTIYSEVKESLKRNSRKCTVNIKRKLEFPFNSPIIIMDLLNEKLNKFGWKISYFRVDDNNTLNSSKFWILCQDSLSDEFCKCKVYLYIYNKKENEWDTYCLSNGTYRRHLNYINTHKELWDSIEH